MPSICFYAGPSDNRDLKNYIHSLGLRVYEGVLQKPEEISEVKAEVYSGWITFLEPDQLHPYPGPTESIPYQISHVTDPFIHWIPAHTVEHNGDQYIIHGHMSWEFRDSDREDEVKLGKQYFGKISRWIRKHWPPPVKRDICRGPEAQKLIQFEGYIPRGLPPSINIEYIQI